MSEQNKANTWWIMWKSGYRNQATVTVEKPFTYNSSLVHVIEKSAFDSVVKERDELKAENGRLKGGVKNFREALVDCFRFAKDGNVWKIEQICDIEIKRIDKALRGADEK